MLNTNKSVGLQNQKTISLEENEGIGYVYFKRIIDILGSFTGLCLLIPIFCIVVLMIKLEEPKGTVFFSQIRVGKNGELFKMYKFRSMIMNAEAELSKIRELNEVSGAMFKMKNDPRVTKIGKFIRKTSIDELPQLFNVLKGDMALVGPRPALPSEVEEYSNYDRQRLLVTPGCTGLWQISGRSNLNFDQMVELDLYYIEKRSLLMDLKVILKTVVVLFGSKDAF